MLVDILISLLTKSALFLRHTVTKIFEQLIEYMDGSDMAHLLEVLERPDQDYIEEMEERE